MTSGLIQYGVPTNVFFFAESVPLSWPETPKSASLTATVALARVFSLPSQGRRNLPSPFALRRILAAARVRSEQVKPSDQSRIDGRFG